MVLSSGFFFHKFRFQGGVIYLFLLKCFYAPCICNISKQDQVIRYLKKNIMLNVVISSPKYFLKDHEIEIPKLFLPFQSFLYIKKFFQHVLYHLAKDFFNFN